MTQVLDIRDRLKDLETRFAEVEASLSAPQVLSDPEQLRKQSKLHTELSKIVAKYRELQELDKQTEQVELLARDTDAEIAELAKAELAALEEQREQLLQALKILLLPKDPLDEKNIIVEIRAGTGGEEAALFAADLFRMYTKYAESKGWRVELLSSNVTGLDGFKEVIFAIEGDQVYSRMKFEAGTHRVQRVPETEAQGRIHTSAATVAVLPEAEEVEIDIRPEELKIDVFRSSGPGGQSVNTTDSAVRVTHVPTGLVVSCQDEKSQHKNKATAMKLLRARLYELQLKEMEEKKEQLNKTKKEIAWGSQIRSYILHPYKMVKDHRTNKVIQQADRVLDGEIDELMRAYLLSQTSSQPG